MNTRRAIATISYNTPAFLKMTLDELLEQHIISDYFAIWHFPEADEKKGHFHVTMIPNKLLDTMQLGLRFIEPVAGDKPLKCIDFRHSNEDEAILYYEHFAPYLASKGECREYHYQKEDFLFADEDTFDYLYHHAHYASDWAKRFQILQALNDGTVEPADLIKNGTVPLNMASQLNAFYYMQTHYSLDRNGRGNHEE